MATLYVRNVPDDLYQKLRTLAAQNHRSLSAQVIVLIEEALKREELRERRLQALEDIARLRATIKPSAGPDSLDDIREDRAR
jgi:plasmid stability protein